MAYCSIRIAAFRVRLPVSPPILNFPIFARPIRPREARKGMETLARRARRGAFQERIILEEAAED